MKTGTVGQNSTCGGAVVGALIHTIHEKPKPLLLYEYKAVTDPRPLSIKESDLLEVLVQAMYCLHAYVVNHIIYCLTDLVTWHYMKNSRKGRSSISIEWCHSITEEEPLLETQFEFVHDAVAYPATN